MDLGQYIGPGDRVVLAQGTAEPQGLARMLVAQRRRFPRIEVFLGPSFTPVFTGETDGMSFLSYGALGCLGDLAASGRLDVLTMPYGRLCGAFATDEMRADVVMLQTAPPNADGCYSAGLSNDFAAGAAGRAGVLLIRGGWEHGLDTRCPTRSWLLWASSRPALNVMGDTALDLIESGSLTNAHKGLDIGEHGVRHTPALRLRPWPA